MINRKLIDTPTDDLEKSTLWIIKIVAGLLMVVLFTLHFIVNHLIATEGLLNYWDVVAYYKNPIIPLIEIIFLIAVVSHSFIGIRSIVLDLNPPRRFFKIFDPLIIILGLVAILYGIWLALFIFRIQIP
jgi:succinate dehydrogenase hydrophobic anchor subunit